MSGEAITEAHSLDAFHRGAFHLVQPVGAAHRAGMDAMMLAAAVPSSFAGRLADLGAGAGAAGLAVLARCPGATAVLVEREPRMAGFARLTTDHPSNAALSMRCSVLEGDVAVAGKARIAQGLADNSFEFAIMNPPFNRTGDRSSPDALRRAAHVMEDGLFEKWVRTAAAIVRPRGGMALIARPQSLPDILAALAGRFGAIGILPILPRQDACAIRIVARGVRGSRAGLSVLPPLVLHETGSDRFSRRADAINNGSDSLFGD